MLLIGSSNARIGFAAGMHVLRSGGCALDAVEATIREVESNPRDHSVGYGSLPNILGEVELDASIMDGATLAAGAVCAVRGFEHPISLAREVMRRLPHVLLAGDGAERLAESLGWRRRKLLSAEARRIWSLKGGRKADPRGASLRDLVRAAVRDPEAVLDPRRRFGTVNVIAVDARGDLASGVSTGGWAWKYPGRVGDSPIIGAGNYADNRWGACCCTGYGEMALRASTARSVVLYLKEGRGLADACREALRDLRALAVPFPPLLGLVAVDDRRRHVAWTTETGRRATYLWQTEGMRAPATGIRRVVPLPRPGRGASAALGAAAAQPSRR